MPSEAQLAANHANAQLSTGPKTEEGKSKSSLNAVKTGLTGRTVLLPGDDLDAYNLHIERCFRNHAPEGEQEEVLVQTIAETEWRLARIPSLEMGIYAIGRLELGDKFADQDPTVRTALIEARVYLAYEKQLKNLSVQESRLRRAREKDVAALQALQAERSEARSALLQLAAQHYKQAVAAHESFNPQELGFDFSMDEIATAAQAQTKSFALINSSAAYSGLSL